MPSTAPLSPVQAADLYARLSAPHKDSALAGVELDAFLLEVSALRLKHRIPNVAMVITMNYMDTIDAAGCSLDEPAEQTFITRSFSGDTRMEPKMFAFGFGHAKASRPDANADHVAHMMELGRHACEATAAMNAAERAAGAPDAISDTHAPA